MFDVAIIELERRHARRRHRQPEGRHGQNDPATNLAWVLAEKGNVLLVDADPQASTLNWVVGESEVPNTLTVQGTETDDIPRLVRSKVADSYDWVIIDGPPGITKTSADAVRVADVVLIPTQPSPLDVWAASDIVAAVRARLPEDDQR